MSLRWNTNRRKEKYQQDKGRLNGELGKFPHPEEIGTGCSGGVSHPWRDFKAVRGHGAVLALDSVTLEVFSTLNHCLNKIFMFYSYLQALPPF